MSTLPPKTASELLTTPVQFLKGVGPERGELLSRMGLRCARDVLFFFPRDYEDMSELRPIGRLEEGQPVSVCGWVEEVELKTTAGGKVILGVLVREQNEFLRAIWFNQAFLRPKFRWGGKVLLSGTPKMNGFRWEMVHPKVAFLGDNEEPPPGRILPVYGLTEGVNQQQMRRVVHGAVEQYASLLDEVLPESLRDAKRIWPIQAALPQLHAPRDKTSLEQARHRFVYQELLVLQLGLAMRRAKRERDCRAPVLDCTDRIDERIRRLFPFSFTADQNRAIADVVADLRRGVPMNRLLQGDVGSGKTVVAMYAMLLAVSQGYQAALMAPTEVLARQHARTLERSLRESRVRIGLLTGSISAAGRREMLQSISSGEIDLVVGTHAVIHAVARSDARFARLALVVIDEQHKFGVRERAALREAGIEPHYLVMTATPIPRTVSMTLFGDLDLSTLRSSPPGRQPVHTYLASDEQRPRWWEFFRKKLCEGRQGIVIVPMVEDQEIDIRQELENWNNGPTSPDSSSEAGTELVALSRSTPVAESPAAESPAAESGATESETLDGDGQDGVRGGEEIASDESADGEMGRPAIASVARAYESLVNGPLAEFRVDLIHGRLSAAEKDRAMEQFRDGETQVLVATSVIEVGVDVPNVAVMTIENGERFGLAQLHQLRGRVGRGGHAGYVCVFANPNPNSELSQRRLQAFTRTTDGFELAELDFELRGPGDLFGTRQHGLPPLRIADLRRDIDVLRDARTDAQAIIAADPELRAPEFARLRRMMLVRYGESLDLGDVG